MCRGHHNRKTHDGFDYVRPNPETGETVWTTPLGFVYRQAPVSYGPSGADTGDTTFEGLRGQAKPRPPEREASPPSCPDDPDPPPF